MHRTFPTLIVVVVAFLALGTVFAASAGDALKIPADFQHWYLVNSMIITKDSPLFSTIGGLHHIYINSVGLPGSNRAGPRPIFACHTPQKSNDFTFSTYLR